MRTIQRAIFLGAIFLEESCADFCNLWVGDINRRSCVFRKCLEFFELYFFLLRSGLSAATGVANVEIMKMAELLSRMESISKFQILSAFPNFPWKDNAAHQNSIAGMRDREK
ncbi:MAG: hypothetical protein HW387_1760 [Parachlamydiales bacterium]|nr:hypothetical protein [Parachlamydiales bacterium]